MHENEEKKTPLSPSSSHKKIFDFCCFFGFVFSFFFFVDLVSCFRREKEKEGKKSPRSPMTFFA